MVGRRLVPVDARTADWPRKVAQKANNLEARLTQRERLTRAKLRFFYG